MRQKYDRVKHHHEYCMEFKHAWRLITKCSSFQPKNYYQPENNKISNRMMAKARYYDDTIKRALCLLSCVVGAFLNSG